MSDVITPRKLSRLEQIKSLPPQMRDEALIDWRTFATLFDRKDVESARGLAAKHRLRLVDTGRRKLPRWKDVKALIAALTAIPTE